MKEEFKERIEFYLTEVNVIQGVINAISDINKVLIKTPPEFQKAFYKDGCCTGKIFDQYLPSRLSTVSSVTFKHGKDKSEEDCVCIEDKRFNSELKSTLAEHGPNKRQYIPASKTNAGKRNKNSTKYITDDYKIYIFVGLHPPKNKNEQLSINDIYVGLLKPSDFKTSKSSGSGSASVPKKEVFDKQFIRIYTTRTDELKL